MFPYMRTDRGAWLGWCALLLMLLVLGLGVAVTWGSVSVHPLAVWQIAARQVGEQLGFEPGADGVWPVQHAQIIWLIRMPRVLLAALAGAGLALVGAVMQAMVRNPLADPYLLGVSSGASAGAVSVLAWGSAAGAGILSLTGAAFLGALLAMVLVYALARSGGRMQSHRLVLVGVAVGHVLTGLTSLITLTAGQRNLADAVLTWTLGSLSGTQWSDLGAPALLLVLVGGWLLLLARPLNALQGGEESATTLGVDIPRFRRLLFVLLSLLTGALVAVAGPVGFAGLIVPHVARMLVGSDHRRMLPVAALSGAVFLVLVDWLARVLFSPLEIPVGVITALLGGPFFVFMLLRQSGMREGR